MSSLIGGHINIIVAINKDKSCKAGVSKLAAVVFITSAHSPPGTLLLSPFFPHMKFHLSFQAISSYLP